MKAEAVPFTPKHKQLCGITSKKDPHLHLAQGSLSGSHRYQGGAQHMLAGHQSRSCAHSGDIYGSFIRTVFMAQD